MVGSNYTFGFFLFFTFLKNVKKGQPLCFSHHVTQFIVVNIVNDIMLTPSETYRSC